MTMRKSVLPYLVLIIIFFLAGALATFYFYVLSTKNPPLRKTEVTISATTFDVEVASTTVSRARGLSYRPGLAEGTGMLFLFDNYDRYGFWMQDMQFPLDMIWIKGDRVVSFSENAVPEPTKPMWSLKIYYPSEPVDKVLEVNAGTVAKIGMKEGDLVVIRVE